MPVFQPRPHIIAADRKPQSHSGESSKGGNFILTFLRAVLVWRVCGGNSAEFGVHAGTVKCSTENEK